MQVNRGVPALRSRLLAVIVVLLVAGIGNTSLGLAAGRHPGQPASAHIDDGRGDTQAPGPGTLRSVTPDSPLTPPSWTQVANGSSPPKLSTYAIAYDSAANETVLFGSDWASGGLETWAFVNGSWTNLSPAHSPPGAAANGMTYDSADAELLLFGVESSYPRYGGILNETWAFRGGDWSQVDTPVAPPGRWNGAMAYDGTDGETVLFGGENESSYAISNSTWAFVNGTWVNETAGPSPAVRVWFTMAADPSTGGIVLFGGFTIINEETAGVFANDTWTFLHNRWVNRTSSIGPSPSPRSGASMASDPATSGDVLFGGYGPLGDSDYPTSYHDTWEYSNGTWTNVSSALSPHGRYGATMSYEQGGGVLLYGGCDSTCDEAGYDLYFDSWVFGAGPLRGSISVLPATTYVGVAVAFAALAVGGTQPYSFNWSFGDGSPYSTTAAVSHRYTAAGAYSVGFQLSDSLGAVWNASTEVEIAPATLLSLALSATSTNLTVGESATFTTQATGGVPPYTISWAFGDGTSATGGASETSHAFDAPGYFAVWSFVNDSALGSARAEIDIAVTYVPLPFTVTVLTNRSDGPAPLAVQFTATVSSGISPAGYDWSFGDGSAQAATPSVGHTFVQPGTFDVLVVVEDTLGRTVAGSTTISVLPSAGVPPIALQVSLEVQASTNLPGAPVTFTTNVSGGQSPYAYVWTGLPTGCPGLNSTAETCKLPAFGTLVVTVKVTDTRGVAASATAAISVQPSAQTTVPPPANATASLPEGVWVGLGAALALALLATGLAVFAVASGRRPKT